MHGCVTAIHTECGAAGALGFTAKGILHQLPPSTCARNPPPLPLQGRNCAVTALYKEFTQQQQQLCRYCGSAAQHRRLCSAMQLLRSKSPSVQSSNPPRRRRQHRWPQRRTPAMEPPSSPRASHGRSCSPGTCGRHPCCRFCRRSHKLPSAKRPRWDTASRRRRRLAPAAVGHEHAASTGATTARHARPLRLALERESCAAS